MKKLVIFFSALAMISSCAKLEMPEPILKDEPNVSPAPDSCLPKVLYASVSDKQNSQTRTYVDEKTVMWQQGDAISYFAGNHHNAQYAYKGETPASVVELEYIADGTTNENVLSRSIGIYPYDEGVTVDNETVHVTYPGSQTYAPDSFGTGANLMIATGSNSNDDNLYFRNACGYLVIKLYGNTAVKNITLSSADDTEKISGKASIVTDENGFPVVTMSETASSQVVLDCSNGGKGVALSTDKGNPTEFWFALPPVDIEGGIRIVATDIEERVFMMETAKTVNITRNNIQPMAALRFVSNVPAYNTIYYTKTGGDENPLTFEIPFESTITHHYYDKEIGKFVIEFDAPVKTLNAYAFRNIMIQTIELPEGLKTIGKEAFRNTPLTEIIIPGSVATIAQDAFYDCDALTSVTFLPSETNTPLDIYCQTSGFSEYGTFYDSPLTYININRELRYKNSDDKDFVAEDRKEGIFSNEDYESVESVIVTIGSQVTTIPEYMFANLRIQELTIPGTVTAICNDAFTGCSRLKSLTFKPSPTNTALTFGYKADEVDDQGLFDDASLRELNLDRELIYTFPEDEIDNMYEGPFGVNGYLKTITLGSQVRTLHPYIFAEAEITEMIIPGTVNEIKDFAFYNCTELGSIRFEAGTTPLTIGFQPAGLLENERGPFYQSPLTSIYVNRELVASEAYAAARDADDEGIFSASTVDRDVTVTLQAHAVISDYMFSGVGIRTIWIPREISRIGFRAFHNCSKLHGMTLAHTYATHPITLDKGSDEHAFIGTLFSDPDSRPWIALEDGSDENVNNFKRDEAWSEFANIIVAQRTNP